MYKQYMLIRKGDYADIVINGNLCLHINYNDLGNYSFDLYREVEEGKEDENDFITGTFVTKKDLEVNENEKRN